MRAGLLRWRTATVVLLVGVLGVGCDDSAADRKVREALRAAQDTAAAAAPSEEGDQARANARKLLETAAANTDASLGMRATAKAALAQSEFDAANRIIREIDRKEMELSRVAWETTQLALQVHTSGSAIAGYKLFDPKTVREAIATRIAEAQGGPDKPAWFTHGGATIPTLSAVKQDIARLEGEISQVQEQIKSLSDQRSHLLDDAEQAAAQADQQKGEAAVEIFKKSSDLRRQGGEKAIELDKLNAKVTRLQHELAISQSQQTVLNEVVTQFQEQAASLEASWKTIDDQIKSHQDLAQQILGTPTGAQSSEQPQSTAGQSIADKAVALARLVTEIDKLRGEAETSLTSAAKHFEDAATAARDLNVELGKKISDPGNAGRPEQPAWKDLRSAVDPMQFRLQQASVQRVLGEFYASRAASAANRLSVRQSVEDAFKLAGLKVPEQIASGDLAKDRQAAVGLSDEAYKESDKLLSDIVDGTNEDLKPMAHVSRALTLYGWAQTERMAGNTDGAEKHITDAKSDRDLAAEHNVPLPSMPSELGLPPPKAVAPVAATEGAPTTEASPEEPAIKTVINSFVDAMEKGDADAAKASCQIDAGGEELFATLIKFGSEWKKFTAAATEKYGAQVGELLKAFPDIGNTMKTGKITVKGDEAFIEGMAAPGEEHEKDLVKVNDQWKIFVGVPKDSEKKERDMMKKVADALPQITADVQSGKLATPQDALKALGDAAGIAAQ
ncbi:MAG TPA: hypothetical protein VH518_02350 [Tepidisphaeraceae bacterium]|jgi:hypothetical protein